MKGVASFYNPTLLQTQAQPHFLSSLVLQWKHASDEAIQGISS